MSYIWNFIQSQILGMKWLSALTESLLSLVGIDTGLAMGGIIHFFLYDTVKIFILLTVLIFLVSYIQSYFPPERTKRILGGFKGLWANILAALLGTVTPFCSCSSIPLFIGFTRSGLSSGITFSFLISSPLVDLGSLILLTGIFGIKIAVVYVIVGLVLAVLGGYLIEKTGMGRHVEDFVKNGNSVSGEILTYSFRERVKYSLEQVAATVKKVAPYIFIGVGIGAAIHNFIPEEFVVAALGEDKWYSVLIAVVVGVPMYADIFGTVPVAEALFAKGAGIGTILSFMMSVTALSLPSIIMLRKAVKPKLLAFFVFIVTLGIIIIGYTFNSLSYLFV